MWDANIGTTTRFLDAAEAAKAPRIVYVSTVGDLRQHEGPGGRRDVPPEHPRRASSAGTTRRSSARTRSPCSGSRAGAPIVVRPARARSTVPATTRRSASSSRSPTPASCRIARSTDVGVGFVHVDDLAAGIVAALDRGAAGRSYVLSGPRHRLGRGDGDRGPARREAAARLSHPERRRSASSRPSGRLVGQANLREVVDAAAGVTYWASNERAGRGARLAPARPRGGPAGTRSRRSRIALTLADRCSASSRCSSRTAAAAHGHHGTAEPITIAMGGGSFGRGGGRLDRPAAPPRLDPGEAALGRELPRPQAPAPRPEPQHGLRGGPLPEHRRVLGPAHRHDHDPRRHLHPRLRLLQRQDRPADLVRRRRAAPGRRGALGARAGARRRDVRRPRRPARRRRARLRRDDPRSCGSECRAWASRSSSPTSTGRRRRCGTSWPLGRTS